jgi:hypothetical protein
MAGALLWDIRAGFLSAGRLPRKRLNIAWQRISVSRALLPLRQRNRAMRMIATTCASLVFFRFIRSQANSRPRRSNGTDGSIPSKKAPPSFSFSLSLSFLDCALHQRSLLFCVWLGQRRRGASRGGPDQTTQGCNAKKGTCRKTTIVDHNNCSTLWNAVSEQTLALAPTQA